MLAGAAQDEAASCNRSPGECAGQNRLGSTPDARATQISWMCLLITCCTSAARYQSLDMRVMGCEQAVQLTQHVQRLIEAVAVARTNILAWRLSKIHCTSVDPLGGNPEPSNNPLDGQPGCSRDDRDDMTNHDICTFSVTDDFDSSEVYSQTVDFPMDRYEIIDHASYINTIFRDNGGDLAYAALEKESQLHADSVCILSASESSYGWHSVFTSSPSQGRCSCIIVM